MSSRGQKSRSFAHTEPCFPICTHSRTHIPSYIGSFTLACPHILRGIDGLHWRTAKNHMISLHFLPYRIVSYHVVHAIITFLLAFNSSFSSFSFEMHVENAMVLEHRHKWMNYCATRFLNAQVKLANAKRVYTLQSKVSRRPSDNWQRGKLSMGKKRG